MIKALIALAVFLAPAFWAAPAMADVSSKTIRAIDRASSQLEGGDRAAAIDTLNGRLDDRDLNEEDRAALYLGRAQVYAAGPTPDFAAAESDLAAALTEPGINPALRDEAAILLANVYVRQDKPDEALSFLKGYTNRYGSSTDAMAMIDELEVSSGQRIPTDLPDRQLRPVSTPAPSFPAGCARGASEYTAQVLFNVTAAGEIENVRVVEASDPCLEPAAVAAVTRWRFDPAVQSGYFVATRDVPVTVTFSAR